MANFNITVDLDWVGGDEEGVSIDAEVKGEIIHQIANKILSKKENNIEALVEKQINEVKEKAFSELSILIDKKMNNFIETWLDDGVIKITDRYGDVKREHKNIKEMLKGRFDKMLIETVDSNGRSGYHSSGREKPRLDWMFEKFGEKQLKEKIEKAIKDVTINLEKTLEEGIKESVGKSIFKHAGLSKLIKKTNKVIEG